MQNVLSFRLGKGVRAAALLAALWSLPAVGPAAALNLFARHTVTVQFATADGKPMADAEVRVFAPGRPSQPELTGRTDSAGKFEFSANADGMWSAEAHGASEIARVTVRVGGTEGTEDTEPVSPYWVVGGLLVLLILALGYRVVRARSRTRPNRPAPPPRAP
jgi:hypothetical protein